MLKLPIPFVMLLIVIASAGCSGSQGGLPHSTTTTTDLTRSNFTVIRSNVRGESSGFSLFGLIPIVSPSYADAMAQLHHGTNMEGKATALANVAQDHSSIYLILFSLPKITVTADIIQFTSESEAANTSVREPRL